MKHIKTLIFWKDIPGYEGLYQVNQFGQVKSLPRKGTKGGIMTMHERKDGKHNKRYLRVALSKNNQTKWFSVHRLVAEAFLPNPENLPEVDHINNNEMDNRVSNLQWINRKDNIIKDQGKRVKCVETGQIFNTASDAAEWCGANRKNCGNILEQIKGNYNKMYGYHWEEI